MTEKEIYKIYIAIPDFVRQDITSAIFDIPIKNSKAVCFVILCVILSSKNPIISLNVRIKCSFITFSPPPDLRGYTSPGKTETEQSPGHPEHCFLHSLHCRVYPESDCHRSCSVR